ncbi:MAG TPA: PQQ-binding-like beta-propeller repeat protein [Rhizomicrobium sp.]|nr:PQQ-binding-like beta-propeller repeat protein [Rhizomicrobium sp.]
MRIRTGMHHAIRAAMCIGLACAGPAAGQAPPPADNAPGHETPPAAAPPVINQHAHPITANVTVTDAQLLNADKDQDNWLLHGRTYDNQRFSPLTQVNQKNVSQLRPVAIIQTGVARSFEVTPTVVNGVMYIITPGDIVQAYDAVSGRPLWNYAPTLAFSNVCCGPEARGVTVAYGKVFAALLDGSVMALDAKTGDPVWRTDPAATLPPEHFFYSFTLAPQVYDGMVIVGSSGAEYPTRGFVQAYDARDGKLIWRFRTTAAPDEPGGDSWSGDSWKYGGGSVWNTPAVDPKNGLIAFAVGNPNPDVYGENRKGANAYTDSIVGVNVKTGKLAWWHQEVPHDVWDYDACAPVIFMDALDENGKLVPAAAEAGKVGNVFIVNRLTGKLLRKSEPFALQTANIFTPPSDTPVTIAPGPNGGSQWSPAAYSPRTHDFYVMGVNQAATFAARKTEPHVEGQPVVGQIIGGTMKIILDDTTVPGTPAPTGSLSAVNVNTGKIDWQYKSELPMVGGVLATASDLVFAGEMDGNINAFNARTGKKLWHFNLGVAVTAPPMTYRVNGVQYVAVAAGGLGVNGWPQLMAKMGRPLNGDVVAIFALPEKSK